MKQTQYPILEKLGLSENEAVIYEFLIAGGRQKARDLVNASGLGRGNVYNLLGQLQEKNFAGGGRR